MQFKKNWAMGSFDGLWSLFISHDVVQDSFEIYNLRASSFWDSIVSKVQKLIRLEDRLFLQGLEVHVNPINLGSLSIFFPL